MKGCRYMIFAVLFFSNSYLVRGQRNYAPNSVLATGNWYKFSIRDPGIYKLDISFLNSLGVNTNSLSSASIRIYGNGGRMLEESNGGRWTDDLQENAIQIIDGGDGVINGADHILFFAPGPNEWVKDSANQRFFHRKNIYSDRSWYFLSVGGNGRRISTAPSFSPVSTVTSFSERYFHELDTVNFLSSGKEWYGEEFSDAPGRTLVRNFNVSIPNIQNNTALLLQSNLVARSISSGSRFDIRINNIPSGQFTINPVSGGQYDLFAQQVTGLASATATSSTVSVSYSYVPGSFNAQGWLNW